MVFFISSNTFLGVVKLHVFRKKILGTLRDALRRGKKEMEKVGTKPKAYSLANETTKPFVPAVTHAAASVLSSVAKSDMGA